MYGLIVFSVVCASLNSTLLHKIPDAAKKNVFLFNFWCSAEWIVLLSLFTRGNLHITAEVVFWGVLYGIIQVLFLFFKTCAMANGSVSVTTLIGNCSLLLSTAAGVLIWQESVRVVQIVCIALLVLSVILCTFVKKTEMTNTWKLYCVAFFVCAAAVGIIFKFFSYSAVAEYANGMMLIAACTMSVLFLLLSFAKRTDGEHTLRLHFGKSMWIMILCGILSCVYNRLNIVLSGALPGAVFFPSFNGGVVILSCLMSMVFLKERLVLRQIVGLVLGTCAIIVIGIL